MNINYNYEQLKNIKIAVTPSHKFGTDAFLLSHFAAPRKKDLAVDFCTGSGIVALLWQRDGFCAPKFAHCVEIQPQAVAQLHHTIEQNGLQNKMQAHNIDIKDTAAIKALGTGIFDLISCNPPYKAVGHGIVSEGASDKLARHETECTMDDIAKAANVLLKFGGRLCLCQRPERLPDIICTLRAHKIEVKKIKFVQRNISSVPWLVLVEANKGAKPFLNVEPPLIVQGANGFSDEMLKIYGKI